MTIFFPDISNHEPGLSLHGATAVIAKATQGDWFTDGWYTKFKTQAAMLGIPFMGYHWPDTGDLAAQAQYAYATLRDTPTMWDAEAPGATVPRLVELTHRYRALGGNPRSFYLPRWFWADMGSPVLTPLADLGLYLISSDYVAYSDDGPGWDAYGGVAPAQWQYTSTQWFNGMRCDFNAYKGTVDDLRRLWGLEADDMTPEQANALTDSLVILTGMANGVDQVPVHDKDGVLSLKPFYARIAKEAAKDPVDHTHTVTATAAGSTGPAQPLDPEPVAEPAAP